MTPCQAASLRSVRIFAKSHLLAIHPCIRLWPASAAGFAVFRSPLKEDSEPALRMLRESQHQLIMITGGCVDGFSSVLLSCFWKIVMLGRVSDSQLGSAHSISHSRHCTALTWRR